jgi:Asp-tRNA(Asn)/Glu-tRNA(Gln) amidotransferase C subunit
MKDGKPNHIGYISGITEEIEEQFAKNPEEIIGKVAEISAMEIEHIGEDYSLRHAKIIQWRKDKTKEDCEFSQVE